MNINNNDINNMWHEKYDDNYNQWKKAVRHLWPVCLSWEEVAVSVFLCAPLIPVKENGTSWK